MAPNTRDHRLPAWTRLLIIPATAATLTAVLVTNPSSPWLWLSLPAALAAPTLIWTDLDRHVLPDRITIPIFITTALGLALLSLSHATWEPALRAVAALLLVEIALVAAIAAGADLGLGDLKLLATLTLSTAALGWQTLIALITLSVLANGLFAAALLLMTAATRRTRMPLGPGLLLGWLGAISMTG